MVMHILHVEDNEDDRVLIEMMVQESLNNPFELEWADRVSSAVSRLTDENKPPVDVVLLDLTLPGSSGIDTFQNVASHASHIPIIVMSGMNDQELGLTSVRFGAQDYLVKGKVTGDLLSRSLKYAVERKKAQTKFEESKRTLTTLMNNIPGLMYRCTYDADLTFEFTSMRSGLLSDVISDQQPGSCPNHKEIVHPNDWPRVSHTIHHEIKERRPFQVTYRIRTESGNRRWVWEKGTGVFNQKGEVTAVEGFITDITSQYRADQYQNLQVAVSLILADASILDDAASKILKVICNTLDWQVGALWHPEPRGAVLRCHGLWNDSFLQAGDFLNAMQSNTFKKGMGLPGQVWESRQSTWISDMTRDAEFPHAPDALNAGLHGAFAFPIMMDKEILGVLEFYSSHVQESDPDLVSLISSIGGQVAQFLERKRLEEQLRLSQKLEAVGQLAGGIAHDFNNLLTAINGHCSMLLMDMTDMKDDDPLKYSLGQIQYAGERAAALTRQLLAFGRKQVLELKVVNLNDSVKAIDGLIRRLLGESIAWSMNLAPDLACIKADVGQLEQVLMNLAINARDAMPKGGTLTIETKNVEVDDLFARSHSPLTPGPYVRLIVTDNGIGMDAQTQSKIFEPFFTTKEKGKGTGLGMATVYGIVKQSGGYIWVYSELEKGTSVCLYFKPEAGTKQALSVEGVDHQDLKGSETILLVEDEDVVRSLVRLVLQSHGYHVLEARNGKEALAVSRRYQNHIHLLLTDTIMPEMHGPELAKRLSAERVDMKLLYMSGYTDKAIVQHSILASGAEFLPKPFQAKALAKKVRTVLDRPRTV